MKILYMMINYLHKLWTVCYDVNIKLGSWGDNEPGTPL